MQQVYRLYITDATYPHDGAAVQDILDVEVFNKFKDLYKVEDVELPKEFESDGAFEWLYSIEESNPSIEYPFILMGEAWLWSNC